ANRRAGSRRLIPLAGSAANDRHRRAGLRRSRAGDVAGGAPQFCQAAMNAVIKLQEVHKIYHTGEVDVHAVRGVSLEIAQGEFVALMGASGSGNSTMMNALGCLDRPTRAKYFLDGIDVSELNRDERADTRKQKLGVVSHASH